MPSTTDTLRATVDRALTHPFPDLWQNAAEITLFAVDAYTEGLSALVEQQLAVQRASEQWLSSLVSPGSAGPRRAEPQTRAADLASVRPARAGSSAAKAARTTPRNRAGSTRRAADADTTPNSAPAGPTPVPSSEPSDAGAKKRESTPPARRPAVTSTSRLALADAVGPALAKWTPEGYDTLTAAEVVEKLPQFSQQELQAVETHEKAHQARRTVLERINSLRGPEPVPRYDELKVPEIETRLTEADNELAARIRDYERSHKGREGVLRAAEAKLA